MALLTCDFFSDALQVGTSMTVVLPQQTEEQIGVTGGASDGAATPAVPVARSLRRPHRLAPLHRHLPVRRKAGLAVVMPAVHRSFYANEAQGHRYWDFVSEELPGIVHEFLRVTDRPEETFVAGLSMGGYGALKLALTYPERYAAAASLSGALDLRTLLLLPERADLLGRVFGGTVTDENDLFTLLQHATGVPPLYLGCGTEDPLLPGTERFADEATDCGARGHPRPAPRHPRVGGLGPDDRRRHRLAAAPAAGRLR